LTAALLASTILSFLIEKPAKDEKSTSFVVQRKILKEVEEQVAYEDTEYTEQRIKVKIFNGIKSRSQYKTIKIPKTVKKYKSVKVPKIIEQPAYELEIRHKNTIYINSDDFLALSVKNLGPIFTNINRSMDDPFISVELKSNSFVFHENSNFRMPAKIGYETLKVFTPKLTGENRLITVNSYISNEKEKRPDSDVKHTQTVKVEVLPEILILGLSEKQIKGIQMISGTIGIPSLILLFATYWINRRKKQKPDEEKSPIIIP